MAKFRAMFRCIHDWDPVPGSPVSPGCVHSTLKPGIAVDRSMPESAAPMLYRSSVSLCSAPYLATVFGCRATLALAKCDGSLFFLSTPKAFGLGLVMLWTI